MQTRADMSHQNHFMRKLIHIFFILAVFTLGTTRLSAQEEYETTYLSDEGYYITADGERKGDRDSSNVIGERINELLKSRMFNASTIDEARSLRDGIISDYSPVAPKAVNVLDTGFEDAMTVMQLPEWMRTKLRSSNWIERLNREFKRRSDVIQIFPNAASILRLMGAVAIEYNDQMSVKQRVFAEKTFARIRIELIPKLKEIASVQQALLDAA